MLHEEYQYLRILRKLLTEGVYREGRNGGTYGLFGEQMRFDLSKGFPLLTTKKVHWKSIVVELLWFLRGDTNVKFLHDHGVTIWDEWADKNGELGPVYGRQWRQWKSYQGLDYDAGGNRFMDVEVIDQIANLIQSLKRDPYGRRHIVTAWNPAEIEDMALPPCHSFWQCHVANGKLNLHLYQRSADWFLGVPFNIASYALLTHILAREVGLDVGEFIHSFGDLHLYANHVDQASVQLEREPYRFPDLEMSCFDMPFDELHPDMFSLANYRHHPAIKADVSK
jgi:thymidylate synthase